MGLSPFLTLALILLAVGVVLYVGLPWAMAFKLLRPPRMSDGKAVYLLKRLTPADLGMGYEDVTFAIRDEQAGGRLDVTGWWLPHPGGGSKTVLLIHGYADAKVGAIAWAPLWQSLGYHILAIDLRAHGGSGGVNVTAGYWERHDVSQVIDRLSAERPGETREVAIFGISLGAAVALATGAMRDDLRAVVVESPFATYPMAVECHANLTGMPGPAFVRRAVRLAERIAGASFAEVAPVKTVVECRCPVMVISAGEDPLVGRSLPLLEAAVGRRGDGSVFWEVRGAYHVECLMDDYDEYRRRIAAFLASASPDARDAVRVERPVNADDRHPLDLRLGDQ